jgi:hypothetical protein
MTSVDLLIEKEAAKMIIDAWRDNKDVRKVK